MKNYASCSNEELALLYVGGDNRAFDELLARNQQKLYSYIMFVVRDPEQADDIFQETFVKVIVTLKQGRYVENGHFSAWISRIAHNLIIDHFRQSRAVNLQSTDDTEYNVLNRKELSDQTIEDSMVTQQIHRDIRRLIKALPESQREVLLMRYYKNMSFKEIAERTQVSINTALGRMRYAILNMRRIAEEHNIVLTV